MTEDRSVIDPTSAFAESGGQLTAMVAASALPVSLVDVSTVRIVFANAAACRLGRLTLDQMVGRSLYEFATEPDKIRDGITALLSGAVESYQAPRVFLRADGSSFDGRVWVRLGVDGDRRVLIIVFTDDRGTGTFDAPLGFALPPPVLQVVPGLDLLTGRENEVLERLVAGARVPQIAEQMHLAPPTVRNHLSSIYRKLGVHSQADLVALLRPSPAPSGDQ